ncbi:MAG: FMN-binding protein [Oscillospiraceae bacterium]|nr:FMN-binding protein [Oscillospiraceae bacterium]
MEAIVKPTVVLLIICVVISASLAFTYALTKDRIEASEMEEANKARSAVFPESEFEPVFILSREEIARINELPAVIELYSASHVGEGEDAGVEGELASGYVATVLANGYGGTFQIVVGVSGEGKISGVRVTKHKETPGLGAEVTDLHFCGQYEGKDASLEPGRDIVAVSGATTTSNAVTMAVKEAALVIEALN